MYNLTKKQKEELKILLAEAYVKDNADQSGEYMYRVREPPCS